MWEDLKLSKSKEVRDLITAMKECYLKANLVEIEIILKVKLIQVRKIFFFCTLGLGNDKVLQSFLINNYSTNTTDNRYPNMNAASDTRGNHNIETNTKKI